VIGLGSELLRTTALVQALLRKRLGPQLTEKDRNSPWIGLRPLCSPRSFLHAQVLASTSLSFMVLFTFLLLSPIISYILSFSFLVLEIGYRHQLVYIYPSTPDSGGRIWMSFIIIALVCMFIAELILMSYMAFAKAPTQFYMLIPLVVVTALFNVYIHQKHFRVARFLSSETSIDCDNRNNLTGAAKYGLLHNKYLQPALIHVDEQQQNETIAQELAPERVESAGE
jgi:calcium permeable stress-gated cation channel